MTFARFSGFFLLGFLLLASGCDLIPTKPEAVLQLYSQRMKDQNVAEARKLLSPKSLALVNELEKRYRLDQPVEYIALMNSLDPITPITLMKSESNMALLQVRTIKGALRMIKLVKTNDSPWQVDISDELRELDNFLKAREALDLIREQAGEYAASWKTFNDRVQSMNHSDLDPQQNSLKEPAKNHTEPKLKQKTKKRADSAKK